MTVDHTRTLRTLTAYEAEQVRHLEAWQAQRPHAIGETLERVAAPATRLFEKVVPEFLMTEALDRTYETAQWLADTHDILRRGSVATIQELRHKDFALSDRLTDDVGKWARDIALAEGALVGMGGVVTAALDIPAIITIALRTVHRIGYCYGYVATSEYDKYFILCILLAASANSIAEKTAALEYLGQVDASLLRQARGDLGRDVIEEPLIVRGGGMLIARSLAQQLGVSMSTSGTFQVLPVVGAVTSGLFNRWYIDAVATSARHTFQARWLRDNGKRHTIFLASPSASAVAPVTAAEVPESRWLPKTVYVSAYYVSYSVVFGSLLVARMVPTHNAFGRGLREGANAAQAAVRQRVADHAEKRDASRTTQGTVRLLADPIEA